MTSSIGCGSLTVNVRPRAISCSLGTAAFLFLCSCNPLFRAGLSTDCEEFLRVPHNGRDATFRTYTLEKQVNVYLCMMNKEPPAMGLAEPIADRGEEVIPYLLERLKEQRTDYARDDILYIFELLSEKGHLRNRADVLDRIREAISMMKNAGRKQMSLERLDRIRENNQRAHPSSPQGRQPSNNRLLKPLFPSVPALPLRGLHGEPDQFKVSVVEIEDVTTSDSAAFGAATRTSMPMFKMIQFRLSIRPDTASSEKAFKLLNALASISARVGVAV